MFNGFSEKQEAVHHMLSSERRRLEDLQNDAMLDALVRFFFVLWGRLMRPAASCRKHEICSGGEHPAAKIQINVIKCTKFIHLHVKTSQNKTYILHVGSLYL